SRVGRHEFQTVRSSGCAYLQGQRREDSRDRGDGVHDALRLQNRLGKVKLAAGIGSGASRVYPIVDTATLARLGFEPVRAAAAVLEGGAGILQFRHKEFWSREVFAQAEEVAALCRQASALFILNDRADYASL